MNFSNRIKEKMNVLLKLSSLSSEYFDFSSFDLFFDDLEKKLVKFEKIFIPDEAIEMNFIYSEELTINELENIFSNLEESIVDRETMRKNCKVDDDGFVIFDNF